LTDHVTALKAAADPQRVAASPGGFYQQIPLPGTFTCTNCGEFP
jgi:hypothetical protein